MASTAGLRFQRSKGTVVYIHYANSSTSWQTSSSTPGRSQSSRARSIWWHESRGRFRPARGGSGKPRGPPDRSANLSNHCRTCPPADVPIRITTHRPQTKSIRHRTTHHSGGVGACHDTTLDNRQADHELDLTEVHCDAIHRSSHSFEEKGVKITNNPEKTCD